VGIAFADLNKSALKGASWAEPAVQDMRVSLRAIRFQLERFADHALAGFEERQTRFFPTPEAVSEPEPMPATRPAVPRKLHKTDDNSKMDRLAGIQGADTVVVDLDALGTMLAVEHAYRETRAETPTTKSSSQQAGDRESSRPG
jgi:hypothetical protein